MLTPFGKSVRKARIDTNTTMSQLAAHLGVSIPFLSAVENGRRSAPATWNDKLKNFFSLYGLSVDFAKSLAQSAKYINIESLPLQTANVLTRLSAVNLNNASKENYEKLVEILTAIEEEDRK